MPMCPYKGFKTNYSRSQIEYSFFWKRVSMIIVGRMGSMQFSLSFSFKVQITKYKEYK